MKTDPDTASRHKLHIRRIINLLKHSEEYKKEYAFMLFFLVLQMASYLLLAYSLQFLINRLFPLNKASLMLGYLGVWTGLFVLHALFTVVAAKFRIIIVRSLVAAIRSEIIKKLQVLSIKNFDARGTGATSTRILRDVERMQQFFDWLMSSFAQAALGIFVAIPFLTTIDPLLTVIAYLYVPTVPILQRFFRRKVAVRSYTLRNSNERLSEKLVDYISGIKYIRMFATEDDHSRMVIDEIHSVREADIRYTTVMRVLAMAMQFFRDVTPIALWVTAGILMIGNTDLTLGAVVAYIALVNQLLGNMNLLFSSFDEIVATSPSVNAISEILDNTEIENPTPLIHSFTIDGGIRVENLDFSYETREGQKQLSQISFSVEPGEKVALVGKSGSGKSTLINLLLGLYPIKTGNIYFGGYEIRALKLRKLREQIAIMTQETFLFNTTILENLRFANLTASHDRIVDACRRAEILEFIESLPQKFETSTGERGVQLSVGQRQRLGLARVFLRQPRIIILDEPSSALDALTEHKLFQTLNEYVKDITVIIVAHRLSTIRNADRILVLDNGRIMQEGTFDQLRSVEGLFANMAMVAF